MVMLLWYCTLALFFVITNIVLAMGYYMSRVMRNEIRWANIDVILSFKTIIQVIYSCSLLDDIILNCLFCI